MGRAVAARAEPAACIFPVGHRFSKYFLYPPVMEAFLHSDGQAYHVRVHQHTHTLTQARWMSSSQRGF